MFILLIPMVLLKTFAPMVAAMFVAYRMLRAGGSLFRKLVACVVATVAGLMAYVVVALVVPLEMGVPSFGALSLLIEFGYALAGALAGLAVARRLRFVAPPTRTFNS